MTDHIPVNMTVMKDPKGDGVFTGEGGGMSIEEIRESLSENGMAFIDSGDIATLLTKIDVLTIENAGLKKYADSRDESIKVYRQEIAELKKQFETALSLIDGAMVIVELSALESPAQKEWRDNWLRRARELLGYRKEKKCK